MPSRILQNPYAIDFLKVNLKDMQRNVLNIYFSFFFFRNASTKIQTNVGHATDLFNILTLKIILWKVTKKQRWWRQLSPTVVDLEKSQSSVRHHYQHWFKRRVEFNKRIHTHVVTSTTYRRYEIASSPKFNHIVHTLFYIYILPILCSVNQIAKTSKEIKLNSQIFTFLFTF